MSLVVHHDVGSVDHALGVQDWDHRDRDDDCKQAVHDDHESILNLQDEVVESLAFEKDYGKDEWKHYDADGEESDCDAPEELVVAAAVL